MERRMPRPFQLGQHNQTTMLFPIHRMQEHDDAAYRADLWEARQQKSTTIRLYNLGHRMTVELNGKEVINTYCPTIEIAIDEIVKVPAE